MVAMVLHVERTKQRGKKGQQHVDLMLSFLCLLANSDFFSFPNDSPENTGNRMQCYFCSCWTLHIATCLPSIHAYREYHHLTS